MEPPVDRIKLSQSAKEQLLKLKRITKIDQWNILCRWALCRSLADSSLPSPVPIPSDSNLEITWQAFGGDIANQLIVTLKQWCYNRGLATDKDNLAHQLRQHIHRGISYLVSDSNIRSIKDLTEISLVANKISNKNG